MENLAELQLKWFQTLHQHPELGEEEAESTAMIHRLLGQYGIRRRPFPLPTGAVAEIGHGTGRIIGLRSDLDALPIQEETDLPYCSKYAGRMHACGHDFHTAVMLGTAVMLREMEDQLPGKAVIVFQPSEEIGNGAQQVISTGATDDAEVFLAVHSYPYFDCGTLGIREGPVMAAVDEFTIHIHGIGTHAGSPHKGIDPVPVAAELTMALQTIVSRRLSPFDDAVLSVTCINTESTWNVIPQEAKLNGTVRSLEERVRRDIRRHIGHISRQICAAHDCKCSVDWFEGSPAVINDPRLCRIAKNTAEALGLRVDRQEDTMEGEDFSEYLHMPHERPGLFVRVGTGGGWANHHPRFTVDPAALYPTACFLRDLTVCLMRDGWNIQE